MTTWEEPPLFDRQRRRIHAQLTGFGITLRGDRLTILCQILDRTVLSTNGLTMVEADRVIEALTRYGTDGDAVRRAYLDSAAAQERAS